MSALPVLTTDPPPIETIRPARPDTTIIGLDLGQRRDWTALAIVEKRWQLRPDPTALGQLRRASVYSVPYLDRTQNHSYEAIADNVAKLTQRPEMAGARLVADETGVGAGVCDMLDARRLYPQRITITGGDTATRNGRSHRVPKRDLAAAVAVTLESGRLLIAKELPLAETLRKELENFKVTISLTGHDQYGAGADWRDGNHDDLVLAVAMAVWFGERFGNNQPTVW